MKRLLISIFLVALALVSVGCEDEKQGDSGNLKVALVVTGAITDNGWCQIGYEGLKAIEKEYGAEVVYNENTQASQYNQIIRTYAKEGYDVIIAHGMEFKDAVKEVAKEYPEVQYFISSSDRTADVTNGINISGILADGVEQGFLQGVTAGYIAQNQGSKQVAAVGGLEIPAIKTTIEGFELGVHYIDPSIEVMKSYTGSFDDINKLKEQSITFIQQGATVVMSTANAATKGGFEATKDKGGVSIGANASGLLETYKDNLAFTSNVSMVKAMTKVVGYYVAGDFKAANFISGVKEEVVTIEFSKTQPDVLKVQDKVQKIFDDIKSGKMDVTTLYQASKK
ncbi:MAG: BMP family protein [Fusobacteria bacterium]|nr:BMP family protein [Fusobacteriota bacterium]